MLLNCLLLFLPLISFTPPSHASTSGPGSSHSPPPSVPPAAAPPILRNLPFTVVWNMPTARCHRRHNIDLDLKDFYIVENKRQRFQGQRMTIYYRDHLGTYPYLSHEGGKVNGGLPQLGNLSVHLALTTTEVSGMLWPNFTGLGVIDWEEWHPLWGRNSGAKRKYRQLSKLLVKQQSPYLSQRATVAAARREFEESAQKYMEGTLQAVVRERPRGHWGFYSFPVCFNKQRTTDKSYTGLCRRGTKRLNDRLSWLWFGSTALYPSIYLQQQSLGGSRDAVLMVRHTVLEALRVASVWRHGNTSSHSTPVIPYARLAFAHTLNFLNETDLMHTLGESAALGAAGVVLWGETQFAKSEHQCALLRDYLHTVLGPFIRSLTADAHRCSLRLCHGNGRCVRRRPNSGHMFFSRVASKPDKRELNSSHFRCQCYTGWNGSNCQNKG
ncbi:hyaluronidase-3 [Nelusetta ayraudi]|uniref:hyaluronidase-3 n=1 Tax=Nelusetta ayraudi TaxID=303726 RepID=UPI003F70DDC2